MLDITSGVTLYKNL